MRLLFYIFVVFAIFIFSFGIVSGQDSNPIDTVKSAPG